MSDTYRKGDVAEELTGIPGVLSYQIGDPPRHVDVPVTVIGKNSFKTHDAEGAKRVADDFKGGRPNPLTFTYDDEKYGPHKPSDLHPIQSAAQPTTVERNILTGLIRINDLLPMPKLRKQQRKMLADQQVHIADLMREGRQSAARVNEFSTWFLWGWYLVTRPIFLLGIALVKCVMGKA